jgi:predicted nucleic acid-binding protein
MECAVAAGSRFIVTGDNDLLRLGSYAEIQIVKAADFLELIRPAMP